MRKLKYLSVLICLLALLTLALTSCASRLSTPGGLNIEDATQSLRWNAVKGARFYTVSIEGNENDITTKANYVSLEHLKPGTYEVKIVANGDGESVKDSRAATFKFERAAESGLLYQLINNGTEYQLVDAGTLSGDVVMESVYRNKPVTAIADAALYNNPRITSFTVGENVRTIGEKAFSQCAKLKTVILPSGVVEIGQYCFRRSEELTNIIIPDTVLKINPYTFTGCSGLKSVTVGNATTEICEYAFSDCEALESVTYSGCTVSDYALCLPDTVKTVASNAFSECKALGGIYLGGVESIGESAFVNCAAASSLYLGESLTSIGDWAFSFCPSLISVTVPDSCLSIGHGAFSHCTALADVHLGSGLNRVGYYVFESTAIRSSKTDILAIDGWLIEVIDKTKANLSIPEGVYGIADYASLDHTALVELDAEGIKYVGAYAFYGCPELYKVSFDDSLLTVGECAFSACEYLNTVSFGRSLDSIGDYAFHGCVKLSNMDLPSSLTSVGTRAFRDTKLYNDFAKNSTGPVQLGNWIVDFVPGKSYLASAKIEDGVRGIAKYAFSNQSVVLITLPDTLEYICRGAFYQCTAYMINLPDSIKYIGDYAFYGCVLANFGGAESYDLVIPSSTEYVGRSAFYGCTSVLSLTVPGSVKTIGDYAFYGCTNIGNTVTLSKDTGKTDENGIKIMEEIVINGFISLADGIEHIGARAFQGCEYITSVAIPDSVKTVGQRAFYKCTRLKSISLGAGIEKISDRTFYKCDSLEEAIVSDGLKVIGDYAFRGCAKLNSFDLGNVTEIGRYSFYGCASFTEINLPSTLTRVGDYAFRGCNSVTAITLPDSVLTVGKHAFYGLNRATLFCEAEQLPAGWSEHYNSSYRPVIFGAELSEEGYVVSITVTEEALLNSTATNGTSAPIRDGYTFGGWTTVMGGKTEEYTASALSDVPEGTVLYAIWNENANDSQTEA